MPRKTPSKKSPKRRSTKGSTDTDEPSTSLGTLFRESGGLAAIVAAAAVGEPEGARRGEAGDLVPRHEGGDREAPELGNRGHSAVLNPRPHRAAVALCMRLYLLSPRKPYSFRCQGNRSCHFRAFGRNCHRNRLVFLTEGPKRHRKSVNHATKKAQTTSSMVSLVLPKPRYHL